MARFREVDPAALDAEARAVYDRIVGSRGFLPTPHAILMQHPPLADPIGQLGARLRFQGLLPDDLREVAILTVARSAGAPYEWVTHEPIARQAGVPDATLRAIASEGALEALRPEHALAIRAARALVAERTLPEPLFAELRSALGEAGLTEFVVLCGYYLLLALVLRAYDAPLPAGTRAPF